MTIVWLISPLFSLIVIIGFLLNTRFNLGKLNYITFLISLTFGVVAYTQDGHGGLLYETDIVRYYNYYYKISGYTLNDFVEIQLLSNPNIFFDVINFLLTRIFPDNAQVFSLFWITLIYFISSKALLKLLDLYELAINYKTKIILLLFGIFSLLSFSYILDLIKQSASIAIFFYCIVTRLEGRKTQGYFLLLIAVLIHSSTLILVPIFFLIGKKNKTGILIITIIFYGIFYFLGDSYLGGIILGLLDSQYTASVSENILKYNDMNNVTGWKNIHVIQQIVIVFLFIFQFLLFIKLKKIDFHNLKNKNLLIVSFFSFLILIATSGNTHTFLRFLNTYSLFFILPIISKLSIQKNLIPVFRQPLILGYMLYMTFFSWFYFNLRLIDSNRSYGMTLLNDDFLELFFTSVFGFLNHSIS